MKPKDDLIFDLLNQGIQFHQQGDLGRALHLYDQISKLDSRNFDAIQLTGAIHLQDARYDLALNFLGEALKINDINPDVWNNHGITLQKLNRHDEALFSFDKALQIDPKYVNALYNKGDTLQDLKRFDEALSCYDKLLNLAPNHADAYNNRGVCLHEIGVYEEALKNYIKAIDLFPLHADAYFNLGVTLERQIKYQEAEACYQRALQINPGSADIQWNLSLVQLRLKKFESGFSLYRSRWQCSNFKSKHLETTLPYWSGQISNERVLLWPEQGLGDELFYAGMIQALGDLAGSDITLLVDHRLKTIFSRSFPELHVVDRVEPKDLHPGGKYTAQAPIGDLGVITKLNEEKILKYARPYVLPDLDRVEQIRNKYGLSNNHVICGISWKSLGKDHSKEKSASLLDFLPLLETKGIYFVNLQYGDVSEEIREVKQTSDCDVIDSREIDLFNDIESLLALVYLCDFVVTTSNVTAHLAGAVGKVSFVLPPFSTGRIWYWHTNGHKSLWYPAVTVTDPREESDWENVIFDLTRSIRDKFRPPLT